MRLNCGRITDKLAIEWLNFVHVRQFSSSTQLCLWNTAANMLVIIFCLLFRSLLETSKQVWLP